MRPLAHMVNPPSPSSSAVWGADTPRQHSPERMVRPNGLRHDPPTGKWPNSFESDPDIILSSISAGADVGAGAGVGGGVVRISECVVSSVPTVFVSSDVFVDVVVVFVAVRFGH